MRINDNGIYRDETQEEIAQREAQELARLQSMSYAELVSYFIRKKYTQDDEYALINNYLLDSETYGEDYRTYQAYRAECKARAREIKPTL